MVSVASLLNPVPSVFEGYRQSPQSSSTRHISDCISQAYPTPAPKKQKMSKDAAIFKKGKIQGEVRYPPWEAYDHTTAKELQSFSVKPLGHISEFRRHIPYNSDKKTFLEKTGRGAFEVFQYEFRLPGQDRVYNVMWDYNIGLVRITPFFKCCQYAKTMPAKMLNSNPGLRDICHSITGGALAAQGYWMPFEAAKAVAATFCYNIRYVLTPLFGPGFVSLCIKEGTEQFGHMVIDPQIVLRCTEEAQEYRRTYAWESSRNLSPGTPETSSLSKWPNRSMRQPTTPTDTESGYFTDSDRREQYRGSPLSNFNWTPQTPRSVKEDLKLPSPRELLASTDPAGGCNAPPNSPDSTGSSISPRCKKVRRYVHEDRESLSLPNVPVQDVVRNAQEPGKRRGGFQLPSKEIAAQLLMQLYMQDTSLKDSEPCTKKRRASCS